MEQPQKPRVKVMCILTHEGKTLASKGYDKNKDETFYRLLGGSLEFGETLEDGVRREIREELHCEIENLIFAKLVENIFTYEGKQGHDLVFLYKGELSDKALYKKETIHIIEPYSEFEAAWIPVEDVLSGKITLYPAADYSDVLKN